MVLTKENQAKVEALNEKKATLKARVEHVKYSGPGGGHRRKMVDDHEEQLTAAVTRLERGKLKYEKLAKMLISMKAGVKHLKDKIAPVREELGMKSIELTDTTVVSVLVETEKSFEKILARMKAAKAEEMALATGALEDEETLLKIGASVQLEEVDDAVLQSRPHNQRIELPSIEGDWEADPQLRQDDTMPDVDEEELTRDKVKKASQQYMTQEQKKKKKTKKQR